jgi:Bacterial PH domain
VFPGQTPEPPGGGGGQAAREPDVISADGAAPDGAASDGAAAAASLQPKTFRLPGARVVWWIWVVFAAANIIDLAIDGRNHTGAVITATLVLITGLVYACALRPRVVADADGLVMENPFRDHRVPWGSVARVDLRESVQIHCAAGSAGTKERILYSWALFAPRRARYRSFRGGQNFANSRSRSPIGSRFGPTPGYGKLPQEAAELQKQNTAQIMAKEIDGLCRQAKERGAAGGPRIVRWAWQPLVAVGVPLLALILVALAH